MPSVPTLKDLTSVGARMDIQGTVKAVQVSWLPFDADLHSKVTHNEW